MILNNIQKPPHIKYMNTISYFFMKVFTYLFKNVFNTPIRFRTLILCIWLVCALYTPAAANRQGTVSRGDFTAGVVLTGSIEASDAERFIVPTSNSWQIQIKWMAEEGSHLNPGDPAIRFDNSNLATEIKNLILSLQTKEEERLQQLQDYNHQKFEVEVNLKQAEVDYEKKKIDASIPKGLESNYRYDQHQLDLKRSKQALENARTEKKVKLATLQSGLKRLDLEIQEERRNLEKKQAMLDSLTLHASTSGTFIWGRHPWNRQKIQIGDNVVATWTIATIPVPQSMRVEAWVNETQIRSVKPGQHADLTLDAYPSRSFKGIVQDVLKSAEKKYHWGNARYFRAIITIDTLDLDIMKPGMSVKCVVNTTRFKDVLLIPLELAAYSEGSFQVTPAGKSAVTVPVLGYNRSHLALDTQKAAQWGIKEGTVLTAPDNLANDAEHKKEDQHDQ